MDNKVLAPVLAGIGIGYLMFSADGQKLVKGLGQSIVPALAGGQQQSSPEKKEPEEGEKKDKEDDD